MCFPSNSLKLGLGSYLDLINDLMASQFVMLLVLFDLCTMIGCHQSSFDPSSAHDPGPISLTLPTLLKIKKQPCRQHLSLLSEYKPFLRRNVIVMNTCVHQTLDVCNFTSAFYLFGVETSGQDRTRFCPAAFGGLKSRQGAEVVAWLCCLGTGNSDPSGGAAKLHFGLPLFLRGFPLPFLQAPAVEHRIFILIQIEHFYVLSFLEITT